MAKILVVDDEELLRELVLEILGRAGYECREASNGPDALKVIEECNSLNRICIASFSSDRLKKVNNAYPEVCLSMGPKEVVKLLLASFGLYRKKIPGNCLQIPIYQYGIKLVTQRFVDYVQSIDLKIHVWTINDVPTMQKLIDMKVDGIITDKPSELKKLNSVN